MSADVTIGLSYVPYKVNDPIDINISQKELEAIFNTPMKVYEQQLILQELLNSAQKGETEEQKQKLALAAKLFLKMHPDCRRDFFKNLLQCKPHLRKMAAGLKANHVYHETQENQQKGSSGLSDNELTEEKQWVRSAATFSIALD